MMSSSSAPCLEICCDSYGSALAARRGGAHRIELCCALDEGGLTPSYGMLAAVADWHDVAKHILIRPRGGDFHYAPEEQQVMLRDIALARRMGMEGVVVGALTLDGDPDLAALRSFVAEAEGLSVTFHRAFDLCRDPDEALEQLVDLGCARILTSGAAPTAEEGIPTLARRVRQARGRIGILPGSGVSATNARRILLETGARELHASARTHLHSPMRFRKSGVAMGASGRDEYLRMETDEEKVRAILQEIIR